MTIPYANMSVKPTKVSCPTPNPSPEALHAHFLQILPRIEEHAQIRFNYLRCPGRRDDAIAEVVALAWKWFLRLIRQGKQVDEFVSVLADYAVRHVRCGRKLCGQERARDVMSSRAQRSKGFTVESLNGSTRRCMEEVLGDPHGQDLMDAFEERLKDNTQSPVPEQAAFRLDFPNWPSRLGARNRAIAEDMALDLGTFELAERHKVSAGRISQLRRELHQDWRRFHDEVC
jgi:hypothetical protein